MNVDMESRRQNTHENIHGHRGVMGIEMMNSEVHWASDYPLGFLIGYAVGTVVTNSKITKIEKESHSNRSKGFDTNLTFNRVDGDNLLGVRFVF